MKIINRTYKFEIKPSNLQRVLLSKHFGCTRYIYNHFLNERKEEYLNNKKTVNYYVQAKHLTELKGCEDTSWLKEVNSQTLQFALRSLDTAYVNFFRGTAKFPRFKSKKDKNSFTIPQNGKLEDGFLHIPKFKEGIKVIAHREVKGKIGKMTISLLPCGKYYVSIFTEEGYIPCEKTGKQIGIDLGIKTFAVTSDGLLFKNNRYLKHYSFKLKQAQKHLSRKKKGSSSFEKQKRKVARLHSRISNCRMDTLHKVSNRLVKSYDVIALEDLNVKGMLANHKLAKHIADASWGTFVNLLSYKAQWNDKQIVKVGRFFPSSKMCSCGWINQDLNLMIREWTCPRCKVTHDRDLLAAKNILKEGLRILSVGTTDYTSGAKIRPSSKKAQAMKLEAHESLAHG